MDGVAYSIQKPQGMLCAAKLKDTLNKSPSAGKRKLAASF